MTINKSLIFVLAVLVLPAAVSAQHDTDIAAMMDAADKMIVSREFDSALEKVDEILRVDPTNKEARRMEVSIQYMMDNDKEAMKLADIAIKEHPADAGLLYMRGLINNTRGRYGKAIEDFDASLSDAPSSLSYKIYLGRGISYMNMLEYDQAMNDLSRSISLNDTSVSAYTTRAMLNYEIKEYKSAVDDFKKALEYSTGNAILYFNLGMAYFRMEETAEACPWFNKSCQLGNENACRMVLMECAREIPDVR